jgi:hypothetical protein
VRAKIGTELKERFKARKGYSVVMKIGCGQVNALLGLIYTRITKQPLATPKHPKLSVRIDAAAGLCASGTKKLRRGQAVDLTTASSELQAQYGAWWHGVS